jgi:hypothetical protein
MFFGIPNRANTAFFVVLDQITGDSLPHIEGVILVVWLGFAPLQ